MTTKVNALSTQDTRTDNAVRLRSKRLLVSMSGNLSNPPYSVSYAINTTGIEITHDTNATGENGYSFAEKVAIGILLSSMVFVAVVGNVLVCAAVFTDRRLKHNSNFFIVSLAIADLLVALVVMTFAIINDIHGRWEFGAVFCRIWISSDIMCSTASILNLCVISLDRYIHIKDPLRYESWMTIRKTVLFIVTVWVLSVLISFVPTHLGWHESPSGTNSTEVNEQCTINLNPIYAIVSSTISFYIPCIVMVSIYVRLYAYARRHVATIKRTQACERFNTNGSAKGTYKLSDHKAAVTLGIIMGVFLLCWVPFFIVNPIAAFCNTCIPSVVFQILTWCGYVNSCLNPIIYSIFNTEFRDAFRRILLPRCFLRRQSKDFSSNSTSSCLTGGKRVKKAEYGPPLTENGASARKNSRERLFADRVTSL